MRRGVVRRRGWTSALLASAAILAAGAAPERSASATFANPIKAAGADPWVLYKDGDYYFTDTEDHEVRLWKTKDLTKLADAPSKVVWRPPASGPGSVSLWAPELHWLDGKWYMYFVASERHHNNDAHRRIYVLENASSDPMEGAWTFKGAVATKYAGIDPTVFTFNGRLYFAYSAYVGDHSDLILSAMATPWALTGPEVDIAAPTYPWEKRGGRRILEAPEFLQGPGSEVFLTYSASACWADDYARGLLSANAGADLPDPRSWRKASEPVFKESPADHGYSTGHNGFFRAPDGRDWLVYHATSKPGARCTHRSIRIQPFSWSASGNPDFGRPVGAGVPLQAPATATSTQSQEGNVR